MKDGSDRSQRLLATVGMTPLVVYEAWLSLKGQGIEIGQIWALSTGRNLLNDLAAYWEGESVQLYLGYIEGLQDVSNGEDHACFEEGLLRWYGWLLASNPTPPIVCLAGGRKTMSAALQWAASQLGAEELVHVLVDSGSATKGHPRSVEEAREVAEQGGLHLIKLGSEAGWNPARKAVLESVPPKSSHAHEGSSPVGLSLEPGNPIRKRLRDLESAARECTSHAGLTQSFPAVTLAGPRWRSRLAEPLCEEDCGWAHSLPKVELHCHLGGFATSGSLLKEVRNAASYPDRLPAQWEPPDHLEIGWPTPDRPIPLEDYRALGDATGSKLLKDPGCLKRHIELLYRALLEDRVLYAEIRCSPNNYASETLGRSAWDVLQDIQRHFSEAIAAAREESPEIYCRVNLLIIATRRTSGDLSSISRHLALAVTGASSSAFPDCGVVGVDLAGQEDRTTRAREFRGAFEAVQRCGLGITAHAGENDDAEGIWQAVFDLSARRLGHALTLSQAPDLLRSVVDRGIGLEMCPLANYQIVGFFPMPGKEPYPLLAYLRAGAKVSVNTDNIGISAGSLTDNLMVLPRLCPGVTCRQVIDIQRNAIETAFAPKETRVAVLEAMNFQLESRVFHF